MRIGPLISPGFIETRQCRARHGTDVGNLTVGQDKIAGLDSRTEFLGRALQVVLSLRAIGEFLNLLRSSVRACSFLNSSRPGCGFPRRSEWRRLDALQLKHGIAHRRLSKVRRVLSA